MILFFDFLSILVSSSFSAFVIEVKDSTDKFHTMIVLYYQLFPFRFTHVINTVVTAVMFLLQFVTVLLIP